MKKYMWEGSQSVLNCFSDSDAESSSHGQIFVKLADKIVSDAERERAVESTEGYFMLANTHCTVYTYYCHPLISHKVNQDTAKCRTNKIPEENISDPCKGFGIEDQAMSLHSLCKQNLRS